ncbi:uncharacterized protein LOC127422079 [Myxocyprinus asiaticus]|uniref:uncharacterized protein LOC127422079 n=1 Tax=Myxocyprinus asiaticus TaxID=70543 RepID=UPI00222249FB|nr:uncharacterized protein LOC127422079 [Myxocyprinus asiaticus]
MASTPSASALSAVLRCQGNILARKQANKQPVASVYGLGMAYDANSDSRPGNSDKSYFRALWGFVFHRERGEIPGVLSVKARFETRDLRKSTKMNCENSDSLVKNCSTAKTKNYECRKMLNMKVSSASQWPTTKPKSYYYSFALNSQLYSVLSKNNLVLQMDGTRLRKLSSRYPWTFCVCIVCSQSMNQNEVDSVFSLGLLSLLKKRLIYLSAAVSDIVREKLGIDWRTNQFHPDCDKLCGCVKCTSENHKDNESKMLEGEASEPGQ